MSDTKIALPHNVIEAVKSGRAMLFLGAGASMEARNEKGDRPPSADELRDLLAEKFFKRSMPNRDLMAVAEMAIASAGGSGQVYEFIRNEFSRYKPSVAHKELSHFFWRSIATTNYDLLVEDGYAEEKRRVQTLVRFVKDSEPVDQRLQEAENPLQYLKLHGCLDHIHDAEIPLVLSREQYQTYSANRTRLFGRLHDMARESPIIFIGYRLDDTHIRELIYKLDSKRRPRWYIVSPDAEEYDIDFWATKNVEVIKLRFGEFMTSLDDAIPILARSPFIGAKTADFPLRRFYTTHSVESVPVRNAVGQDLTLVHSLMPFAEQDPKQFYEGYDTGWGGIINRLDVRRKVEEELLYKALLENESPTAPVLVALRGAAGAGKTIALKRCAFDAASASDALVLWLEPNGALKPTVIEEILDLTQRPLYLFVDQLALQINKILALVHYSRGKSWPLVIVAAEREADWFTYCSTVEEVLPTTFLRVGNLSTDEVNGLLDLLERYNCLGLLRDVPRPEQISAFMEKERADRQLLVALHELTLGRPFEEIVFSEHQRISPELARQLYLDIATMHQFGVQVRAGTISRISGIEYEDFREKFFAPLEGIVRIDRDSYTGDWVYKTRHARVASLVFRQVCPDDASKMAQMSRLISGLDVGYSTDHRAIEGMTRGRALAEAYSEPVGPRAIYEAALLAAPEQAFLHQQWAIFEMHHRLGSLDEAERQAEAARRLDPRNKTIIHTQAEIDRRRAAAEPSSLLRDSLRRRARARLEEMGSGDRFVASSRCKLLVDEVDELSKALSSEPRPHEAISFSEKVRDAEAALLRAQQDFPDDADIIQVEARLHTLLSQEDFALRALERAWTAGPRGSGVAMRIAKSYDAQGRSQEANKILKEAISRDPDNKSAHHDLAMHYLRNGESNTDIIAGHLRKSFSKEDKNFEHRFNYAQFLFMIGDVAGAQEMFEQIEQRAPASFRPREPRAENVITGRLGRFSGTVEAMKEKFLFIRTGSYPKDIFVHLPSLEPEVIDELSVGQSVNFRIRFNRAGPVGVDLKIGRR